ncbi:hypothetical protein BJ085DRAFT_27835 [Dimargaris cristalligena]|uniref:Uncharacterized protein n=1 Tax=Dimargaris cristalligena TaxID=215637 RepID=A0A4P9ZKL2_9FUNG|nr:hypothetical protein BJ085DRAFT_27835 [Dimargaris cristalligena]|eukprot:RKP33633.1 hypothetical protein BJ085DRAFT_27835 [Dimargaris cristalligena]
MLNIQRILLYPGFSNVIKALALPNALGAEKCLSHCLFRTTFSESRFCADEEQKPQSSLALTFTRPQSLTTFTAVDRRNWWWNWAREALATYVWPREKRRQKWFRYRAFMDRVSWDQPEPLFDATHFKFHESGNLLDKSGRIKIQGVSKEDLTLLRHDFGVDRSLKTNSMIVFMRAWGPGETHYYNHTTVPIKTWRVSISCNRTKLAINNAQTKVVARAVRAAVRQIFPNLAKPGFDYLILPKPRIIDTTWNQLVSEIYQIAAASNQDYFRRTGNRQLRFDRRESSRS